MPEKIKNIIAIFFCIASVLFVIVSFIFMIQSMNKADQARFDRDKEACASIGENWRYSPSEGWFGMCLNTKTQETQPVSY